MQLLFTGVPSAVIQAICQVLIHSLWQGLIGGVIAALIVTFTQRSRAVLRYNLLLAVLLLFVLGTGITATIQFRHSYANNSALAGHALTSLYSPPNPSKAGKDVPVDLVTQNVLERLDTWFNEHASIIVLIWLCLFLVKCSQAVGGFRYMHRIRHRNNYEASGFWKERLRELARKTGVKSTIIFLESELIKIPAVIGHLRPVLLVPAGLLCNLPAEQVEAILLHELAHIRRRDFLVNLLQSLIETFFFFNPAIIWISSLIREEREACCDDMVIAHIPQKTNYLEALVSFQELQIYPNTSAVALTGNKHYLLNRVKRMLTMENKKLNVMERTVLILSIVGITAFGFITRETKPNASHAALAKSDIFKPVVEEPKSFAPVISLKIPSTKQKKQIAYSPSRPNIDTVPKSAQSKEEPSFPTISSNSKSDGKTTETQVEATDNQGKHYSVRRVDGQIISLTIDGTVIPKDKYDDYSDVIGKIEEAQRQQMVKRKHDLELRKKELMARQIEMVEKRKLLAQENEKNLQNKNELRKQEYEQKKSEILENQKLYNKKKAEVLKNQHLYNQKKSVMLQNQKLYEQKKLEVLQHQNVYHQRKAEMIQSEKLYRQGRTNDDVSRIITDLGNQNLVKDENDLSFNLNDKELVVNGKKQPAEIHQQFREKYIQNKSDRFIYSKKGNSTSITINKE